MAKDVCGCQCCQNHRSYCGFVKDALRPHIRQKSSATVLDYARGANVRIYEQIEQIQALKLRLAKLQYSIRTADVQSTVGGYPARPITVIDPRQWRDLLEQAK